jgi:hypothetical protein
MGMIRFKNQTEPATPPSGRSELWIDDTSKIMKTKDDTGFIRSYIPNAGIEEAPVDTKKYIRSNATWNEIQYTSNFLLGYTAENVTNKGISNGYASLDLNGFVPITQIPPSAIERLVIVADQTARYALTTSIVQNGDTVKQIDTNIMYYVKDQTNLNNTNGYESYSAGTASSVPWTGITSVPTASTLLTGVLSNLDYITFNNKQNALGYTPENITNKENTTMDNSSTKYPTNNLVKSYVDSFGQWGKLGSVVYYSGGNVGIGTSTAAYPLTIAGLSMAVGDIVIEERKGSFPYATLVGISNNANFGSVAMGNSNSTGAASGGVAIGSSNTVNTDGGLALGRSNTTNGNGTVAIGISVSNSTSGSLMIGPSNTAKITILSTGFTGIGTITPLSQLHSIGAITSGVIGTAGNFQLVRSSDGLVAGGMNSEGLGATRISAGGAGSYIAFQTAGTTNPVRIINTGEVGIGTITPTSTLHVSGSVAKKVTTIVANTSLDSTHCIILCNSINPFNVTLPLVSSCSEREYTIKNINSGIVTVVGTIDGVVNYSLPLQYKYVKVISDGTNWFNVGSN